MSCYGNPRYWVMPYCYVLHCPSVDDCKEERKKRRKKLKDDA